MVTALKIPLARLDTDASAELSDSDLGQQSPRGVPARAAEAFDQTLARWLVLSEASNAISRCMGLPDLYPFIISPIVSQKLALIDDLLRH